MFWLKTVGAWFPTAARRPAKTPPARGATPCREGRPGSPPGNASCPLNRHHLMNRTFESLLEEAGLPRTTRLHDLRHTAASLLFSQGRITVEALAFALGFYPLFVVAGT
jgi:integrase